MPSVTLYPTGTVSCALVGTPVTAELDRHTLINEVVLDPANYIKSINPLEVAVFTWGNVPASASRITALTLMVTCNFVLGNPLVRADVLLNGGLVAYTYFTGDDDPVVFSGLNILAEAWNSGTKTLRLEAVYGT